MSDYLKDMSLSFRRILIDIRCVSLSCLFSIFSWNLVHLQSWNLVLSDRLKCIYMWISKFVRWRETNLKFKRLSATCTCFCRLSLSACLLQLLFQIFKDFLLFVHLTSALPWFPNLVQTALFPELIFLVLTWIQGTCLLRCWLCLSTVRRV